MRRVLSAPSRVVLPDCSAGWRRNSRGGVGRETPGHSTSSLQSQGSIYCSPPWRCLFGLSFAGSLFDMFVEVLGPWHSESLLLPKGKHLLTASSSGSCAISVWPNMPLKKMICPAATVVVMAHPHCPSWFSCFLLCLFTINMFFIQQCLSDLAPSSETPCPLKWWNSSQDEFSSVF